MWVSQIYPSWGARCCSPAPRFAPDKFEFVTFVCVNHMTNKRKSEQSSNDVWTLAILNSNTRQHQLTFRSLAHSTVSTSSESLASTTELRPRLSPHPGCKFCKVMKSCKGRDISRGLEQVRNVAHSMVDPAWHETIFSLPFYLPLGRDVGKRARVSYQGWYSASGKLKYRRTTSPYITTSAM
jgi:hypothetical protein